MDTVLTKIHRLEIPLKGSPLKAVNCYIIQGEDGRGLLIDTGFNCDEGEAMILGALRELGIDPEKTDIFLTHMHVDHSGLAHRLKKPGNRVFASAVDGAMINGFQDPSHWDWIIKNNIYTGTPENEALSSQEHVAYRYRPEDVVEFDTVAPGDELEVGEYSFRVVDLKGHSPGQIGLYSPQRKILFCGDHILNTISPNITAWDLENDYLAFFLDSLNYVKTLDIEHLFSAHRKPPEDLYGRIDELLCHHQERLEAVCRAISGGEWRTSYQVARELTWSIKNRFDDFPKSQKWFACSETLAHLQHLYFQGQAERKKEGEVLLYRK